jgi:hypothetical protein
MNQTLSNMFSLFSKSKYQIAKNKDVADEYSVREKESGAIIYVGSKDQCKKFVENRMQLSV